MGARLHAIRDACSLDSDMRTEDNINDILEFVKDVKFFARLSVLQQRTLCRTMSLEEFGPREFVFQMGESGDKFYIILAGSVGVQVPSQTAPCPNDVHSEKCDCPNRPLETVVFLEKGMGFGELALQSDQPRSATIQTSEKTELLVTKRTDYEMYAGQLHRQFIEQRVKFLRNCPRIEDALQTGLVQTQDIAAMANCLNEVHLSGPTVACRQGDAVDHMIFVRSGSLATLRCVDIEQALREASPPKAERGSKKGRPTIAGNALEQPREVKAKRESGAGIQDQAQAQGSLTQNLAKAMMEMKKKDRAAKMESIEQAEKEKEAEEEEEHQRLRAAFGEHHENVLADNPELKGALKAAPEPQAPDDAQQVPTPRGGKKQVSLAGSDEEPTKGKAMWKRLQSSVKTAGALGKFIGMCEGSESEESGTEAAKQNVKHFADVQAARRKYTQYEFKRLQNEKPKSPRSRARLRRVDSPRGESSKANGATPKKRVRILRIGTIGPYQYFGDQQVCNNEVYPVSLVSDPVAEIYVMSKTDILRRVPRKIVNALFSPEKEIFPSDLQLLEMHRQTERWNAFRRSMHGEALENVSARSKFSGPRGARASNSRIDAASNLEFLGYDPRSDLGTSLLPLPQAVGVALTPKDEETFSQISAMFLRRFDSMKRDPGLREKLAQAGLMRNARLHDGLPGSSLDDDDQDPMAFRFEQHWNKLQKDPIGLDLEEVVTDKDTGKLQTSTVADSLPSASSAPSRPSMRAQRRTSTATDAHNKRVSATGAMSTPDQPPGSAGSFLGGASTSAGSGSDFPSPPPSAPGRSSCASTPASARRKSARVAGEGVELPPLDGRPASQQNSGRRMVGFSEP